MKKLSLIAVATVFCFSGMMAQIGIQFTGVYGGPHLGTSFYDGDKNHTEVGGFIGAEFNRRFIVGWEFYYDQLGSKNYLDYKFDNRDDFAMTYSGPFVRYNFLTERFRPYASIMVAKGTLAPYLDTHEPEKPTIVQPAVGLDVDLARWVHLGVNVAYRSVGKEDFVSHPTNDVNNPFKTNELSSFVLGARLGFYLYRRK